MSSSYSHYFSKNISVYAIFNYQSFNDTLTEDIVSFEQLGPGVYFAVAWTGEDNVLRGYLILSGPMTDYLEEGSNKNDYIFKLSSALHRKSKDKVKLLKKKKKKIK